MNFDEDCFCCIWKILEEDFEREQVAARENRVVDWSFAKNALKYMTINDGLNRVWITAHEQGATSADRQCASYEEVIETFWKIVDLLMKSFDIFNLPEPTLALNLMRHAYRFAQMSGMNFFLTLMDMYYVYPEQYFGPWCLCEIEGCKTGVLTEAQFRELVKVPYNIPYPEIEEEREQMHKHIVWSAIREAQEKLLFCFLKYGVMFLPTPNYSLDTIRYREVLNQLLRFRKSYQPPDGFSWEDVNCSFERKQERRAYTVLRVMELLTQEIRERFYFPYLKPLEMERPPRYPEDISKCRSAFFRCLRRAFETIPEPFVSSNEVRKILRHAYDCIWDAKLELCVNQIIAELEVLHPEAAGPITPRSLQHLSRCQVRENLRQSGNLPNGIKDLGLTTLQKYIALEQ